jgi:DNA-binding MarR family transcriptional regulator
MPQFAAAGSLTAACACGRLRRATRALTQLYDDLLAPTGLRITQFSLLRTLARLGPMRITALADAALIDRTAVSRNLDPLVARGLLQIAPGRDAREREVTLTRAGAAAIQAAEPYWKRAQVSVSKRLGREQLDRLVATLAELETLHPAHATRDD